MATRTGNAHHQCIIKIFNSRKKHLENPPHFSQRGGFFLSFLDFVQQVARYGNFFVFVACILMHEGFLTSQYPPAGVSVIHLCFLISTNIYFQHKRGRLRYRTEAKQTQEALLAMSQLEHEVGDFRGLNQQ